jgi:hypothetical protein
MASSKSNASYITLISLRNKLTCLKGVITPEAIDRLKDELGMIFAVGKMHHYEQGQKYGHLASAIPEPKYRLVIRNSTWIHTIPATQVHTPWQCSQLETQLHYKNSMWQSTRS